MCRFCWWVFEQKKEVVISELEYFPLTGKEALPLYEAAFLQIWLQAFCVGGAMSVYTMIVP